jgi:hypothetical protein
VLLDRRPLGLSHHAGIRVHTYDPVKEVCELKSDRPRSAPDVEETPTAVQVEVFGQSGGESRSVGFAAPAVVRGSALEDGLVPVPVLPAMRLEIVGHQFSVPEENSAPTTVHFSIDTSLVQLVA